MDVYEIWCNLRAGKNDQRFAEDVGLYLGRLRSEGLVEGHRVLRRKLGLGPDAAPEWRILIEVRDLAQLERAFQRIARKDPEVERLHAAVYGSVEDVRIGLWRDFPDVFPGAPGALGASGASRPAGAPGAGTGPAPAPGPQVP